MTEKKFNALWIWGFLLMLIIGSSGCGNVSFEDDEGGAGLVQPGSVMINGVHYASDAVNQANIYGKQGDDAPDEPHPPIGLEKTCISSLGTTSVNVIGETELETYINTTIKLNVQLVSVPAEDSDEVSKPLSNATMMWSITRGKSENNNAAIQPEAVTTDANGIATITFIAGTGISSYYVYAFSCNAKDENGEYVPGKFHIRVKGAPHLPSDEFYEGTKDIENDITPPEEITRCAGVDGEMMPSGPTNLQAFVDQKVNLTVEVKSDDIDKVYWKLVRGDASVNDGKFLSGGSLSKNDPNVYISDVKNGAASISFNSGHAYNSRYYINVYNCANLDDPVTFMIDTYILPETMGEKGDSPDLNDMDGDGLPDVTALGLDANGDPCDPKADGCKLVGVDSDGDTIPDFPHPFTPKDIYGDKIIKDPNSPYKGMIDFDGDGIGDCWPEDIFFKKDENGYWVAYYTDKDGNVLPCPDGFAYKYEGPDKDGFYTVVDRDGNPIKIVDIDGDTIPDEITVKYILDENGNLLLIGTDGQPFPMDVDGDGNREIVVIVIEYDEDGNPIVKGYDVDGDGVSDIPVSDKHPDINCENGQKDCTPLNLGNGNDCSKNGGIIKPKGGSFYKMFITTPQEIEVKVPAGDGTKVGWVIVRGKSDKNNAVIGDGTEGKESKDYLENYDHYLPSTYPNGPYYTSTVKDGVAKATFYSGTAYDATYTIHVYDGCNDTPATITIQVIYGLGIPVNEGDSPTENDLTPPNDLEAFQSALGECTLRVVKGNKSEFSMAVAKTVYLDVVLSCPNAKQPIKYQNIHWTVVRGNSEYNNASLGAAKTKVDENGLTANEFFSGTGYNSLYYVNAFHSNVKDAVTFTITVENFTGGSDIVIPDEPVQPDEPIEPDPELPPGGEVVDGICETVSGCTFVKLVGSNMRKVPVNDTEDVRVQLLSIPYKGKTTEDGTPASNKKIHWVLEGPESGFIDAKISRTDDAGIALMTFHTGSKENTDYRLTAYNDNYVECLNEDCSEKQRIPTSVKFTTGKYQDPNKESGSRAVLKLSADKTDTLIQVEDGYKTEKVKYYVFDSTELTCQLDNALDYAEKLEKSSYLLGSKETTKVEADKFTEIELVSTTDFKVDKFKIDHPVTVYAIGFDGTGRMVAYHCLEQKKFPPVKKVDINENDICAEDSNCDKKDGKAYQCFRYYDDDEKGFCKEIATTNLSLNFQLTPRPLKFDGTYKMRSIFNFGSMLMDGSDIGDEFRAFMAKYKEFLSSDPAGKLTDLIWDSLAKPNECATTFCDGFCDEQNHGEEKETCGWLAKNLNKMSFLKPLLKKGIAALLNFAVKESGIEDMVCGVVDGVQFLVLPGTVTLTRASGDKYDGKVTFGGIGVEVLGKSYEFDSELTMIKGTFSGAKLTNNYNMLAVEKFEFVFSYGTLIHELLFKYVIPQNAASTVDAISSFADMIPCDMITSDVSLFGKTLKAKGLKKACEVARAALGVFSISFSSKLNTPVKITSSGSAKLTFSQVLNTSDADLIVNGEWIGSGNIKGQKYAIDGVWTAYRSPSTDYPPMANLADFKAKNSVCQDMFNSIVGEGKAMMVSNQDCLKGSFELDRERNNNCSDNTCRSSTSIVVCTDDGKLNSKYATASKETIFKDANDKCKNANCPADCVNNPEITVCGGGTNAKCWKNKNCSLSSCKGQTSIVVCDPNGNDISDQLIDPDGKKCMEFASEDDKIACFVRVANQSCEGVCDESCNSNPEITVCKREEPVCDFVASNTTCFDDCTQLGCDNKPGCEDNPSVTYCVAEKQCRDKKDDKTAYYKCIEIKLGMDQTMEKTCLKQFAIGTPEYKQCILDFCNSSCVDEGGNIGDCCKIPYHGKCDGSDHAIYCEKGVITRGVCASCTDDGDLCAQALASGGKKGDVCDSEFYMPTCMPTSKIGALDCIDDKVDYSFCFNCEPNPNNEGEAMCDTPRVGDACDVAFKICDDQDPDKAVVCDGSKVSKIDCLKCSAKSFNDVNCDKIEDQPGEGEDCDRSKFIESCADANHALECVDSIVVKSYCDGCKVESGEVQCNTTAISVGDYCDNDASVAGVCMDSNHKFGCSSNEVTSVFCYNCSSNGTNVTCAKDCVNEKGEEGKCCDPATYKESCGENKIAVGSDGKLFSYKKVCDSQTFTVKYDPCSDSTEDCKVETGKASCVFPSGSEQ